MEFSLTQFRDVLYQIPFCQEAWKELIRLLKTLTNSQAGIMIITRDSDHNILTSHSPDFLMSQEIRCEFEKSEWITAAMPETWHTDYLNKGVVLGTDLIPQEKMRATSFYQDILKSLGLEYLMAGVSLFGQDYRTLLKFFRADCHNNFSKHDALLLSNVLPEIRQMMRFSERLHERMVLDTAESKLSAPRGAATIIVNSRGEIVKANKAADDLLSSGTILDARQNKLVATNSLDNTKLKKLIAKAVGESEGPSQDAALVGTVEESIYHLLAMPVPMEMPPFPWMESLKIAAIVVIDPMRKVKVDPNILKTLYNITPAEVDLINAMANGIKPVQYANLANKSIPTVQTQRQAVFQKVGVSNQLGLMSVLRDLTISFEERTHSA